MRKLIGCLMVLGCIGVITFGVVKFYPKFKDYRQSQKLYDDMRDRYIQEPVDLEVSDYNGSGTDGETGTDNAINEIEKEKTDKVSEESASEQVSEAIDPEAISETEENEIVQALLDAGIAKRDVKRHLPPKVNHEALLEENKDYIGWIYIPGTKISYPVVTSNDNVDYLHHNFAGEYNYPGTIFLDARCYDGIFSPYTILYGHNMRDGSMFAVLKNFLKESFVKKHPVFWLITPKKTMLFRIYSVYTTTPSDQAIFGFNDKVETTNVEEIFEKNEILPKWERLHDNSQISIEIDLTEHDHCMTLVTCTSDSTRRNVVTGKVVYEF